ncbi:mCG1038786, partial [Mus musculus]
GYHSSLTCPKAVNLNLSQNSGNLIVTLCLLPGNFIFASILPQVLPKLLG